MSRDGYQAADLLAGTTEEQRTAVTSALQAARLEARTEGWFAAIHALRAEGTRLLDAGRPMTEVGWFDRAVNFLESEAGSNETAGETGDTDGTWTRSS